MRVSLGACAAAVSLVFAVGAAKGAKVNYKVIAHASVGTSSLTRAEVSQLFLKRTARWPDGSPVVPVDLPVNSQTRDAFSRDVHGKATAAVDAFWQKQIFTGREVPPITKANERELLAYVLATPGAIGYVSESTDAGGTKLIDLR
jgi:ABC-type phosphate transport system substrate-binding protein